MMDWNKILRILVEEKDDPPSALRQMAENIPDAMLLKFIDKCYMQQEFLLLKYLEEEAKKRKLISE